MLTQERLLKSFRYDPGSGVFYSKSGKAVGCLDDKGYLRTSIDHRTYRLHRLAFLYMNGAWPVGQVDHIDRDKENNRWANLREVTASENKQNVGRQKNNTSGVTGVVWHKGRSLWQATIMLNQQNIYLGSFENMPDAVAARKSAETRYFTV